MSTLYLRFVSVFLFFLVASAPIAHAQLGVAAGLNFDRLGDISTQSGSTAFDNATGYHFGVFFDLGAAPISVRPGIFIRRAGDLEWELGGVSQTFDLTLIEIPVDVRVPLLAAPLVTPYLLAGPVVSIPRLGDDEVFENLLLSGSIGVGVAIRVPVAGLRLYPELRYAFALSHYIKDTVTVAGVQFDVEEQSRLNAFMLRLGVGL